MGARKYQRFQVDNVCFATVADAAAHFGVQADTVRKALKFGKLDTLGRGTGPVPRPVLIRGKVYPSAWAAAKALGLTADAVRCAIAAGREARVGIKPPFMLNARPVRFGPQEWPSMAAASRAAGMSDGYLSEALRRGRGGMVERLLAAAMRQADGRTARVARRD